MITRTYIVRVGVVPRPEDWPHGRILSFNEQVIWLSRKLAEIIGERQTVECDPPDWEDDAGKGE